MGHCKAGTCAEKNMEDKLKIEICYKNIDCFVSDFHAVYLPAEGSGNVFYCFIFIVVLVTQMCLVPF